MSLSRIHDIKKITSANDMSSKIDYRQISTTTPSTGAQFSDGKVAFKWSMGSNESWIPSRSFCSIRCTLKKSDAEIDTGKGGQETDPFVNKQLLMDDGVGIQMNLGCALFQDAAMLINDVPVSTINSNMAQIAALKARLSCSGAYLNSTGESLNFWHPKIESRQGVVCRDGLDYHSTFEELKTAKELGFPADITTEIKDATSDRITFTSPGGSDIPDLSKIFMPGDRISMSEAAVNATEYVVLGVTADNEVYLGPVASIAIIARPFVRIRQSPGRQAASVSTSFVPPLSVFSQPAALPLGDYELRMTPFNASTYKQRAVETLLEKSGGNSLADGFDFQIDEIKFYVAVMTGATVQNETYLIDLTSIQCDAQDIASANFSQRQISVSPSTVALTVAYQDRRAEGSDSRISPCKFKTYAKDGVGFQEKEVSADQGLNLNRFYVSYANQQRPAEQASPEYKAHSVTGAGAQMGVDYMGKMYTNTLLNSTMFNPAGSETITEWRERGPFYHYKWPTNADQRSTEVSVHQGFTAGTETSQMNVLVFSHIKQYAEVNIENGRVSSVSLVDV